MQLWLETFDKKGAVICKCEGELVKKPAGETWSRTGFKLKEAKCAGCAKAFKKKTVVWACPTKNDPSHPLKKSFAICQKCSKSGLTFGAKNTKFEELLFSQLLDICKEALKDNEAFLKNKIEEAREKEPEGWKSLRSFKEYKALEVRQDVITSQNGGNLVNYPIKIEYPIAQLENWGLAGNYDLTIYIGKLSIIARIINDVFHATMREVFGINPKTGGNKEGTVSYMAGPLKAMERCAAKAMNDYSEEKYPTAAKLLDIVRCALVFNSCQGCVDGVKVLENAVEKSKSCLKEIGRLKNLLNFSIFFH